MNIFKLSVAQPVPTMFKTASTVLVPKHSTAIALKNFCHFALSHIISKCFERLVLSNLKSYFPCTVNPHQFAYCYNRSTVDAISTALHSTMTHLDYHNSYIRMLFIDLSAAFNTVIHSKLRQLAISTSLCKWTFWLTDTLSSTTIARNTGVPQGCMLSPVLFSLFTHDCVSGHGCNTIFMFADDITVVDQIRGDNESIGMRCNIWSHGMTTTTTCSTTKEIIMGFMHIRSKWHTPIFINGVVIECLSSFRFLSIQISEDHTWSPNSSILVKKKNKCNTISTFYRPLRKVTSVPGYWWTSPLRANYELHLSMVWPYGIIWYQTTKHSRGVVKTAQWITSTQLPFIVNTYHRQCLVRPSIKDATYLTHALFSLLPFGRHYRSLCLYTSRIRRSGSLRW